MKVHEDGRPEPSHQERLRPGGELDGSAAAWMLSALRASGGRSLPRAVWQRGRRPHETRRRQAGRLSAALFEARIDSSERAGRIPASFPMRRSSHVNTLRWRRR
jgi:hypothetical protein